MLSYLMVYTLLVKLSRALLMKTAASMSFFWSFWYRMSACDRFFINFGLGGPDGFNANLSELDRRLKETSFRDATELQTSAAMLKLASDLIEDIPLRSLLSYVLRRYVRASPKSPLKMH